MDLLRRSVNRRQFMRGAGSVLALSVVRTPAQSVALVSDPADPTAAAAAAQWAETELEHALSSRGLTVRRYSSLAQANQDDLCIVLAGATSPLATEAVKPAGATVAEVPEALGLVPSSIAGRKVQLACGHDPRGVAYAVLELADSMLHAADPLKALAMAKPITERPANAVRSVARLFTSDVEDKPWYNDREMWPRYLTMLATQRFNRFNLSLGIGYDFLRRVTDAYFLFAYPFFLSVPGYSVRVLQLPDAERDHNLEMLRFVSEQTAARGLEFQLGLWMHGYQWIDSPNANYTIAGLTLETHAPYCRDALRTLLQACPAISGVTLRTHGESGVAEGSYDFWKTVLAGIAECGRRVEIDLHPKGLDQKLLDMAMGTGQPVTVSPKFWAEHLGMPYHQADIRELEQPRPGHQGTGLMKLSEGARSFLRYGYGDLLREDRSWRVIHRIWPGTQRLLLWGDPLAASAYSRAFQFCGSAGVEICEPLSFKGRRGSGIAGDRCAYADASLRPRWDWEKYLYSYRVWGRLLYNPDSHADSWRRYLGKHFGEGASDIESALAHASRILPTVTTAHLPSAANNSYWPEMYTNHSLLDAAHPAPYSDTPAPKVFGNVSPLDPQLFSRINDFADELLSGKGSGKYSPAEVARWLDSYAAAATKHLAHAAAVTKGKQRPEYRRLAMDVTIQSSLGRFFAAKFRAGVLYRIYEQTAARSALKASLSQYRQARAAWAELAGAADGVYMADVTVGELPQLRGHWMDRLPAMDRDLQALSAKLETDKPAEPFALVAQAIKKVLEPPPRPALTCRHTPPARCVPGQPLLLILSVAEEVSTVTLYYRHVNQAERFERLLLHLGPEGYSATIPSGYTDSRYPLQYYFEISTVHAGALFFPGFSKELTNQPYMVVRLSRA